MIRMFAACLSALALAACLSVLPEPDRPDALYRFGPMPATHPIDALVSIGEPEAPRLFAGRAIASEAPDGSLRLVRGVEWADSATRMFQLALLDTLQGNGTGGAIAAGAGPVGDFELSWRLSEFSLNGETARCAMELTLIDEREIGRIRQGAVSETAAASGVSNAARAEAMAEAARACVRGAADFVAENTKDGLKPT